MSAGQPWFRYLAEPTQRRMSDRQWRAVVEFVQRAGIVLTLYAGTSLENWFQWYPAGLLVTPREITNRLGILYRVFGEPEQMTEFRIELPTWEPGMPLDDPVLGRVPIRLAPWQYWFSIPPNAIRITRRRR